MTALHKPERATYGQAIEAQEQYQYENMKCDEDYARCWDPGTKWCC